MCEMNDSAFPELRELDATEPPVELQASSPSLQETTDSSSDLLGSPPSSPIVELPIYPRQQVDEDQEPKSLNQVLENGGLEPKSLSTPQDRPRRPRKCLGGRRSRTIFALLFIFINYIYMYIMRMYCINLQPLVLMVCERRFDI